MPAKPPLEDDALTLPPAEVQIDAVRIAALVRDQAPQFAELPITVVGEGWDNVMARLGPAHAVRLPRRQVAVALLEHEQRWLPHLAPTLPLPIPVPEVCGRPSAAFPWPWSIVPWFDGVTANEAPLGADYVVPYCQFFNALHVAAPPDAPINPVRACPLADKAPRVLERFDIVMKTQRAPPGAEILWPRVTSINFELLRETFLAGASLPIDVEKTWIAGDVHARNVIVYRRRLRAFIDFGDLTVGDRCTDLGSIWGLFVDANARKAAVHTLWLTPESLARAHAWAIFSGITLLQTGLAGHLVHAAMGADVLERLQHDLQAA